MSDYYRLWITSYIKILSINKNEQSIVINTPMIHIKHLRLNSNWRYSMGLNARKWIAQ